VLVLAPDHENLGARIGRPALKNFRFQFDPERLVLRLEPVAEK
jgi:hypothetical protein